MISKITLNNIASYKHITSLKTDKYVNLIYGLNGCGKSTFSNYLKNRRDEKYNDCSIEGFDEDQEEIIVYNTNFVQENFYESAQQKGIFTLSKENKDIEDQIAQTRSCLEKENAIISKKQDEKQAKESDRDKKRGELVNKVWEIKTKYGGGDGVLKYCLDGLNGKKTALFDYLLKIQKSHAEPTETIDSLKRKLQSVSGENAKEYNLLDEISLNAESIESDKIFSKEIVGNTNSSVSALITELKNSDWVKDGLKYLPEVKNVNATCPFCQQKTITAHLVDSIRRYFDKSYENDLEHLKRLLASYTDIIQSLINKTKYESNPKFESHKKDFELLYSKLINVLKQNRKKIENKIKTPSIVVKLEASSKFLAELNSVVQTINKEIQEHNDSFNRIKETKQSIKDLFWQIMRWQYDSELSNYNKEMQRIAKNIEALTTQINSADANIQKQTKLITQLQEQTVNIDEAINRINATLLDIGVTGFEIIKDKESFYKIKRDHDSENIFVTLSEGEKMIISFLYFIELCKGKKSSSEIEKKKIIVIDDPMSSLSNIYVYNIGRLIKNTFFVPAEKNDKKIYPYEQIFVLTHSLYFFYELTDINHKRRKEEQKLFRLQKNEDGSDFKDMGYEEIQNDYQAYWSIIKDERQPVALIANCMRNIVEYFFSFVEKMDLNNFFGREELNNNKFQSLYRYLNRESHSIGQNIYDFKELNYADMKDAFKALFTVAGYEEHYNKMYGSGK